MSGSGNFLRLGNREFHSWTYRGEEFRIYAQKRCVEQRISRNHNHDSRLEKEHRFMS